MVQWINITIASKQDFLTMSYILLHLWNFSSSRPSSFQWKLEKNEACALGEPQLYNSEAMPLTYSVCCYVTINDRKLDQSDCKVACFQDTSERLAQETWCFSANWYNAWGIWSFSAKLSLLNLLVKCFKINKQFFKLLQHDQSSNLLAEKSR